MSGPVVKSHFKNRREYHATPKTRCLSLFRDCQLRLPAPVRKVRPQHLHRRTQCRIILHSDQPMHALRVNAVRPGRTWSKTQKNKKNNGDNDEVQRDALHHLPECLERFIDNLVDGECSASGSEAAGSLESSIPEPAPKVESAKHNVLTHFPKDRNCEVCRRTKITRAPRRKRTGNHIPRAEHVGDLITADHKVLNEECEARNNHRYAVIVQDFTTQMVARLSMQNIDFTEEMEKSFPISVEPNARPKVIKSNSSLEFGKACKDPSWNHCTSTPHRSETNGVAERAVRRVKEGTSAILLQSWCG